MPSTAGYATLNIYKFYRQGNNCLLPYEALHVSTLTGHPQVLHFSHTSMQHFWITVNVNMVSNTFQLMQAMIRN
jgi:hypothetical protein